MVSVMLFRKKEIEDLLEIDQEECVRERVCKREREREREKQWVKRGCSQKEPLYRKFPPVRLTQILVGFGISIK
jgi:hypothetical protein